jgi:RNA polymerase sigma factor (sigma-70 family)
MKAKYDQFRVTKNRIARIQTGGEQVLNRLYATLWEAFFPLAERMLRDHHNAEEVFDDAFMELQAQLNNGFTWQGEAPFCAYFKVILQNKCRDRLRQDERCRRWEAEHLLPNVVKNTEGEEEERVERIGVPDPIMEEAVSAQRNEAMRQAYQEILNFPPRERTEFIAYQEMANTPGSDKWTAWKKTAFLQRCSGLKGNKFYISHSRMKKKAEQVLKSYRLIR